MEYKNVEAESTTITYNRDDIQAPTGNIFEAIAIMGKRAEQIKSELKTELLEKLDEFAAHSDSLDEVFENREQIEVSKFYERLPKPTAIAIKEWLEGGIYFRRPDVEPTK
ncbi:MAG: DNA-directed RNA polymerase subunit omega [Weeksellaceae bacterium]